MCNSENEKYTSVTGDGKYFYFTVCGEKIIVKMNACLKKICCYNTEEIYTDICYNESENCFYGSTENATYKLDKCMKPCKNTSHCKCDKNWKCEKDCKCETDCKNIINSVANIENSIADILKAENEKIMKIISVTDNVADILELNKSVNKTIQNITHLEIILHDKLNYNADNQLCKTMP
jgi:predicted transglutaminase-like cysteine proteinase